MSNYRFILERYRGRGTRYTCPQCGRKHTFTRYIDTENNNKYISDNVGKCNRLDKCGYHYTPRQYFTDNPHKRDWECENVKYIGKFTYSHSHTPPHPPRPAPPKPKVSVLPDGIVRATEGVDSAHMRWIEHLYGTEHRKQLQSLYRTGGLKDAVIFWQRDIEGRVRTGKIMHYDEWSGKRLKEEGSIGWVHALLRREGVLSEEWELAQCLYGEHLLNAYPDKMVAVVEAYKTAHVGAILMPDMVWLATDSLQGLTAERLAPLRGRTVVFFPDEGKGYELWSERLPTIAREVGFSYRISTFMEGRDEGADIADIPIPEEEPPF